MPLIECPECGKPISDKAVSCPNCGNPMGNLHSTAGAIHVATDAGDVVTTEATGKGWKTVQAIGFVMLIIGIISCTAADTIDGRGNTMLMAIAGFVIFIIGRVGAWWNHG